MRINARLRLNAAIVLGLLLLMTAALIGSVWATAAADADTTLAGKMLKSASGRVLLRDDYLLRQSERARIQWDAETKTFRSLLEQARDQLSAADQPILDRIENDFLTTVSLFLQIVEIKETLVSVGADGLPSAEGEQRLVSQLLLQAYSLNNNILELQDSTQATAISARTLSTWLMFSFMLVAVVATLISSVLIQRLLTRRVERLREGMDIIGAGHLDYRIPLAGNDELSDLARAGNAMAARLMETTTSVENLQREVGERKQAEERLREALEELETTLHSIGDAVISTDLEGRVRRLNPVAEQLTGWTEAEAQGRPLAKVFHIVCEETHAPVENPVQRVLREGLIIGLANHTLLIDRNGVERPIADSGAPIRGEGDSTLGVVLVFRDQTRERAAEKELQESEERYRGMMEQAADTIIMHDETGRIVDANRQACRSLGYSREELLSKSIKDIDPEATYAEKQELWGKVLAGEQFTFESRQIRKDGSVIPVEVTLGSVHLPSGSVVLGIVRDITERKRAEERLRESEERFKRISLLISDFAYSCRKPAQGSYQIDWMTGAVERITGHSVEEVIDRKCWSFLVLPEDLPLFERDVAGLVPGQSSRGELRIRHKSGEVRWLQTSTECMADPQDPICHRIFGGCVDITERKRAEGNLVKSEALLSEAEKMGKIGGWTFNVETLTQTWTEETFRILEIDLTTGEPNVPEGLGFIAPAFRPMAEQAIQRAIEFGEPYDQEWEILTAKGNIRWVRAVAKSYQEQGKTKSVSGSFQDITERKRAEEALRESEELYRTMMEQAGDAVFLHDETGRILDVNQKACQSLGYSREELLSKSIEDINPEATHAGKHEQWGKVLAGEQFTLESRQMRKDGSALPVEVTLGSVRLPLGSAILAIVRDITERKLAEENLRRQTVITAAINRVLQGSMEAKTDAEVARICLSEAEELTGSKFGWIGEMNPSGRMDTIALSDPGWELCRIPEAQAETIRDMEIRGIFGRVFKDGTSLIANEPGAHPDRVGLPSGHPELTAFLGVPLKQDGRTVGMVALGNKPSGYAPNDREAIEALSVALVEALRRNRAERALLQEKTFIDKLLDAARDTVFLFEPATGKPLRWNERFAEVSGYSNEEIAGMKAPDDFYDEDDLKKATETTASVFAEGQGIVELSIVTKLGMRIPFEYAATVINSVDGKTLLLSIGRDLTERRQLEKETAKARTDFLYAVSHELKTPLFLMTATVEMMKSQAEEERQRQFLAQEETWIRNLARLRLLINNLVDSQRTADLGTQLNRIPTDLAALVRQATQDLDVFAVKQSVNWQLDLEPLPDLPLDSEAIERTLHNLLTNAIKFSPPGGTVHLRLRADPDQGVLEIEDHGKGIPAAETSRLFQPFARTGGAVKAVIPGTGLGLYVSKVLVEAHGGSISLESEEGKGTTVTVTLPLRG